MLQKVIGPTLLLVEDNPDDEALALRCLRIHLPEAHVGVARTGKEAIECLDGLSTIGRDQFAVVPDLVLLDLKLPFVSGFEVLRAIRTMKATQNIPVVVFTSSDEPTDVKQAYALGANTYIQKPTEFDDYLPTLGEVARYWFELASLPS